MVYFYYFLSFVKRDGGMDAHTGINALKRHIFFEFLDLAGRAYILVKYSEEVILGKRGFTAEEKENGIVLVFNPRMNFTWDEAGITATLVFGASPQKCFIPVGSIAAVYSSELGAHFIASGQALPASSKTAKDLETMHASLRKREPSAGDKKAEGGEAAQEPGRGTDNVIKVDFTKKHRH